MLAYLFWHWPRPQIAAADYEARLVAFHRRLTADPPPGFRWSLTFRVATLPWLGAPAGGYEDWYLVDDFAALEALNAGAVSGSRSEPHDRAAHAAAGGAGGLYRFQRGDLDLTEASNATWLGKLDGVSYTDFDTWLRAWTEETAISTWQRQMVLGPAPEFCILGRGDIHLPESAAAFTIPHHALPDRPPSGKNG